MPGVRRAADFREMQGGLPERTLRVPDRVQLRRVLRAGDQAGRCSRVADVLARSGVGAVPTGLRVPRQARRGIRKLLMPRFDHGIFYTLEGRRIVVAAVIDLLRDSNYVRSRIGI